MALRTWRCLLGILLISNTVYAQSPATKPQVPAPVLSPAEEMKTFKIVEGFKVQLVAAEPLVQDPVAMTFDPDGRVWLCEMQGFMPDIDGKGEREPLCDVCVLEDTDGDGVMDKRTVFLDKLVLPRSVCWTMDGILIAENGHIWLCKDADGDLKSDSKQLVCDYDPGNVEHALNGLMPALDNWIYNAKEGIRLRKIDGRWIKDSTVARGQWGITQDDFGYLVYNVNAQLIRGDLVPCYSPNAQFTNPMVNLQLYTDQIVWPIRSNTGINRGYIPTYLRPDGTMIEANADCGPVIYRGDNLPKELRGDCFINEPAGNLVRRQVFTYDNGVKSSKNAYDKVEFIASTDERFRPVNMSNAPDGTLYMLDMYRGIIQEGQFMTPYLRQEILARQLDKHIGLGRIWRIVHETTQPRKVAPMSKASSAELVTHLSSPNGWHRDMAQQILVQRNDLSVAPALLKLATSGENPIGRLHAVWTLDGLKRMDWQTVSAILEDKDANVRASAVALGRYHVMRDADSPLVNRIAALAKDSDANVRMQIALSLGLVNKSAADEALQPILQNASADPKLLEAILAGFSGREVEFLAARISLPSWSKSEPWREQLLTSTAGLLWRQRQPLAVLRLMHLIATRPADQSWQQITLLEGLKNPPPTGDRRGRGNAPPRAINLPTVPEGLENLRKSPNSRLAMAAENLARQLNWPGKDGKPLPVPPPLSAQDQALYDLGRTHYMNTCAACHHPSGLGDAGKGPPLLDSDWLDNDERLIKQILHGLRGPITVNGEEFNRDGTLEMPGWYQALDDQKIAGILTYVRREWRENAKPIQPESVTKVRAVTAGRTNQWTEKELLGQ